MKPSDSFNKKRGSISALLLVSIFILVTDACFIWINYRSDWQALQREQQQRATHERQAFALALRTVATNMQQIATMVAHDPVVQRLFLEARRAVEQEGGGPGGEESARIRKELYAHLEQVWSEMTDRYDVRQLHFHLPPGSLSFLRVHKPDKFGDTMHDVRFTVVDANEKRLPVKGFETGRVYSGIRGVVPVFARDPQTGERVHVGALEAGTSFESLLKDLSDTFGASFAVLLSWEHVQRNMWQPRIQQRFPQGGVNGWVVEQGGQEAENLLQLPQVAKMLQACNQTTLLLPERNPSLAVNSFPLQDYRGEIEGLASVGRLLEWRDISRDMQVFRGMLLTNIAYGLAGFALIELLLFFAWRIASGRLNRLVQRRTKELENTSAQLRQEVQERFQAEKTIQERAEQYRAIFDDNSCMMLLVEPESGRIVRANAAASRFYGYDQETLQSMNIEDINTLPPDQLRQALLATDSAVSLRHEFTHRLADGEERTVAVHTGPILFEGQRVLFSIIHDITQQRIMEQQLRGTLEELEAIFDNSQVGVTLLDEKRSFLRVNQRFLELFGYTRSEVIGQNAIMIHLSDEHYKRFGEIYYDDLEHKGGVRQLEFPLRHKDGRVLHCMLSKKRITLQDGSTGVVTVLDDITAIKEAERMREDVQRIMRHDLKTPLNAIMGMPQLLRLDGNLEPEQLQYLDHIEESARRMNSIIDLSLDMIKMESGAYQVKSQEVDLVGIIAAVRRELQELQNRKGLQFEMLHQGTPAQDTASMLLWGEERLCYTVVANLLRNAFEAAPAQSTVRVALNKEAGMVCMRMHNHGAVPAEICEHFFEKYATWGKSGGTGLGTYSARLAVEIQGGSIAMHCEEGGTTLEVRLPAA